MKITRSQLRQLIRESMDNQETLNEGLKDLYKQAGMKVPSKQERKKIARILGMDASGSGPTGQYTGTAAQNIELEKRIKAEGGPKAVAKKMKDIGGNIDKTLSQSAGAGTVSPEKKKKYEKATLEMKKAYRALKLPQIDIYAAEGANGPIAKEFDEAMDMLRAVYGKVKKKAE